MSARFRLLFAIAVLSSVGCTATAFRHPLVKPEKAARYTKLDGSFRSDEGNHFLHIGGINEKSLPTGMIQVVSVSRDEKSQLEQVAFLAFAERIGEHYFLHIPFSKPLDPEAAPGTFEKTVFDRSNWDAKQVKEYFIVRISLTKTGFQMAPIDDEFVEGEIEAKRIPGQSTRISERTKKKSDLIAVTADTATLRKFFAKHVNGKLCVNEMMKYRRLD